MEIIEKIAQDEVNSVEHESSVQPSTLSTDKNADQQNDLNVYLKDNYYGKQ